MQNLVLLRSKQNFASVLLHFALKRKWKQFSLLFTFVLASFHFPFASDFYVAHRCKNKRKKPFFRIEAKTISLPFRLISLRSESDGAPYIRAYVGWKWVAVTPEATVRMSPSCVVRYSLIFSYTHFGLFILHRWLTLSAPLV
jgi:hypothetical protein